MEMQRVSQYNIVQPVPAKYPRVVIQHKAIARFKREKYVKLSAATAMMGVSSGMIKKIIKSGGLTPVNKSDIPFADHPKDGAFRMSACKVLFSVSEILSKVLLKEEE